MKLKFLLSLSVLSWLFVGCQAPIAPISNPTETPMAQASTESVPTALPQAELTPTEPALPPTPTPESVPTQAEPTPAELSQEDLAALVMAANEPRNLHTSISPDGTWQVDIVRYDCAQVDPSQEVEIAYEQLLITHISDGTQTVATDQLQYCGGLGAFGLNNFYWSSNSKYFYFNTAREGAPDGAPCSLWDYDFSRVDVTTGAVEQVPGNGIQVNADEITLGWDEQEIVIWDLNAGEIGRVPFANANFQLHSLQMSPAGDQFFYILGNDCWGIQTESLVVLVSLADLTQTILVEAATPGYNSAQWESDTSIYLVSTDGYAWYYDLATNELIQATPSAP